MRWRVTEHHRTTRPIAVAEMELTQPWPTARTFASPYAEVDVLLREQHQPVGLVRVGLIEGQLEAEQIEEAWQRHPEIRKRVRRCRLHERLLKHHPPKTEQKLNWSLIICTRDRSEDLQRGLDALVQLEDISTGEVLIVDNAPSTDATKRLVERYPFRYLRVDRPGLNWARDGGARAANGEVLLYTDDDTVVDRYWIASMRQSFSSPRVGAVTGLILPLELETPAQHTFKRYGGHDRGFDEKTYDRNTLYPAAAGGVGSGANMAFRRDLVIQLNAFGVEMDCGTASRSGGDAYAFYRILAAGYQIHYQPRALVWHRDRREWAALRKMLNGYSVGVFAFLTRILIEHREGDAVEVGLSWFRKHHLRQLLRSVLRQRDRLPLDLLMAECKGVVVGPFAYLQTRRQERRYSRRQA